MTLVPSAPPRVAIVGGGPAGLMAAEVLAGRGVAVQVFDAMPSVGRKFLLAGKGGLNLTHSESLEAFLGRFGTRRDALEPMLRAFGPSQLREWAGSLGVDTFVGSSGRVFPSDLKAAPMLRTWLQRLRAAGIVFHQRHRWVGWASETSKSSPQRVRFETPEGVVDFEADAVVLALGGASWARLGSDGAWLPLLASRGVDVAALRPSNCGFDVARDLGDGSVQAGWTPFFRTRHAGHPVKTVALTFRSADRRDVERRGEFVITEGGVEGSLVYALSAPARDAIEANGEATVHVDLLPHRSLDFVRAEVERPRGSRSLSTHLKSRLGIDGVKAALLHELLPREAIADAARLSAAIKALPLRWVAPRPIDEAISTAGGVRFEAMDSNGMLRAVPGVFCAGEMLDWEAPTGGYLLTACFASGAATARGVARFLAGES